MVITRLLHHIHLLNTPNVRRKVKKKKVYHGLDRTVSWQTVACRGGTPESPHWGDPTVPSLG
ncbi:hypothetical protein Taro_034053 [Colocasia esculenta]|uniref:Uncharacterized protein n=1 Tax=Colocasia esculenta TaxID=4460 RepID=A0A843VZP0_COLES|nr:hypothetical protein [Colocasia esculenta]